jgi:hypothetical protein
MTIEKHQTFLIIKEDIRGTNETFKQKYNGYSVKESKQLFKIAYKTELEKYFFNETV